MADSRDKQLIENTQAAMLRKSTAESAAPVPPSPLLANSLIKNATTSTKIHWMDLLQANRTQLPMLFAITLTDYAKTKWDLAQPKERMEFLLQCNFSDPCKGFVQTKFPPLTSSEANDFYQINDPHWKFYNLPSRREVLRDLAMTVTSNYEIPNKNKI